jgi:hypothetical protein
LLSLTTLPFLLSELLGIGVEVAVEVAVEVEVLSPEVPHANKAVAIIALNNAFFIVYLFYLSI